VAVVTVPVDTPQARRSGEILHRAEGRQHAFFQYLMTDQELREESRRAGFEVLAGGTLPQAHINHVAPRLARQLPGLAYRAANLAATLALSWLERYRVMRFAVLRNPS
jgi:hypothetical protein